jgi:hypothetical protein
MATWKKVIVSGSNISQLNNDSGYLTAGTLGVPNIYNTASFNGTNLIAGSTTASLTFASSSGQGLTIAASAGPNTLTFGLASIPNSSLANSAVTVTAGAGLTGGGSISLGSSATVDVGAGSYITVNANDIAVNTTTLTPAISGSIFTQVSGDISITAGGVATIAANSVALGTDTTGNYVQDITAGSGINTLSAASEGTQQTISVNSGSMLPYYSSSIFGTVTGDITITSAGNAQIAAGTIVNADVNASAAIAASKINFASTGIVSGSSLSSGAQGEVTLTTNGVAGSTIDLGLQTSDSPTFVGLTLTGNLAVLGTASFQNTQNLLVGDRFVLFASGSNTTGDGGIVVQQGTQNIGELYGYDSGTTRWGFTSSFDATGNSFTPAVYAGAVETSATSPSAAPKYGGSASGQGTIHVDTNTGDIYIYV